MHWTEELGYFAVLSDATGPAAIWALNFAKTACAAPSFAPPLVMPAAKDARLLGRSDSGFHSFIMLMTPASTASLPNLPITSSKSP